MKYVVILQYRNWKRDVVQLAHSEVFEDQMAAELALPDLCMKHSAMGWIVEIPVLPFRPPLKVIPS